MGRAKPTRQQLVEALDCNPETGEFTRRHTGKRAGSRRFDGYIIVDVDGRSHYGYILAWIYVHGGEPPRQIDHKDNDTGNNRIWNLRPADHSQNGPNRKRPNTKQAGAAYLDAARNAFGEYARAT